MATHPLENAWVLWEHKHIEKVVSSTYISILKFLENFLSAQNLRHNIYMTNFYYNINYQGHGDDDWSNSMKPICEFTTVEEFWKYWAFIPRPRCVITSQLRFYEGYNIVIIFFFFK